ncbi:hypothetical protein, partial [Streptomyces pseudogriseolus]|uniref:hypothetical protein n=1 Tax=Streptomyces pseudogriseolus TaxID=36817 RepID=UPI00347F14C4
ELLRIRLGHCNILPGRLSASQVRCHRTLQQSHLRQLRLGTADKLAYVTNSYEDGTRRLTGIQVTDDVHSYPLQDLAFTQDDAGNVTSVFDTTTLGGAAKPDHQCFTYDGHSRVTEAWTPKTADCAPAGLTTANIDGSAPYWTSYTYNEAGQRATETTHTSTGDKTTSYVYNDTTKEHQAPHTRQNHRRPHRQLHLRQQRKHHLPPRPDWSADPRLGRGGRPVQGDGRHRADRLPVRRERRAAHPPRLRRR